MNAPAFARETPAVSLVQDIPLDLIFADADQVRRKFDEESLAQLADSIREHGVIQPIVVRPIDSTGVAPFEIIAGERRWRASKLAGRETIPAVIRKDLIGQDVSVLQILENLQRADLTLQETAAGVGKLVEAIGNTKAAQQLGKSAGWVSKHAGLAGLPEDVSALVEAGRIESADTAYELGQLVKLEPESFWTTRLLEKAGEGTLNRGELRDRLSSARQRIEEAKAQAKREKDDAKQRAELAKDPKHQAKLRELEEAERKRCAEMDAATAKRDERGRQLEALDAACDAHILKWIPLIERALGVKAARDTDTGQIDLRDQYLDDELTSLCLRSDNPGRYCDAPIPAGHEDADYILELKLNYAQLQTLLKALQRPAKAAAEPSPEKQSQLCIGTFIAQHIDRSDAEGKTKAAEVYAAYAAWCAANKFDAIAFNDNRWGEAIAEAGFAKHRLKTGWHYLGVMLRDNP